MTDQEIINEANRIYEITFVQTNDDASLVRRILEKAGARIEKEEPLVKAKLTYPIKKEQYGFLGTMSFSGNSSLISSLTEALSLEKSVIRHLIERSSSILKKEGSTVAPQEAKPFVRKMVGAVKRAVQTKSQSLTNEELEKKIEEIMK